jgi:hypothetical protein
MSTVDPTQLSPLLAQINLLQKEDQPMAYEEVEGQPTIVPLTYWQRIWHYRDSTFRIEQDQRIGAILMKELETLTGQKPAAIGENAIVRLASDFFRKHKDTFDPILAQYRTALAALKLGVTVENLEQNPGFEKFALENHLDRYLWKFDHQLSIEDKKIRVKAKGIETAWDKIEKTGTYSEEGFTEEKDTVWKELKPMMTGDPEQEPEWGRRYLYELCTWYSKEAGPRISGDHSWIRLKTPQGDLYSVGLYMPKKHSPGWKEMLQPMSIFRSTLHSPDKSEFWPGQNYETLSVEITAEQFQAMKTQIEKDQAEGIPFQLLCSNCTKYAVKIAEIAKVQLPTDDPWPLYVFPTAITSFCATVYSVLPGFLQSVIDVIAAIFLNTVALLLGGWRVDSEVPDSEKRDPLFTSFWDFFDINKINIYHPYPIATTVRETVLDWRKQESAAHPTEADKIQYQLPPQFVAS